MQTSAPMLNTQGLEVPSLCLHDSRCNTPFCNGDQFAEPLIWFLTRLLHLPSPPHMHRHSMQSFEQSGFNLLQATRHKPKLCKPKPNRFRVQGFGSILEATTPNLLQLGGQKRAEGRCGGPDMVTNMNHGYRQVQGVRINARSLTLKPGP